MCPANNEKQKTANVGRNRSNNPPSKKKNPNARKKETYTHLGILEANVIKQADMKEEIEKELLKRTRKLLETKLYSRNFIKCINTRVKTLIKYSRPFLKWTREAQQMY